MCALVAGAVALTTCRKSIDSEEQPATAESVPDGHQQAVEAAAAATAAQGQRWQELRWLRLCLSKTDVELRDFRDAYNRSLVNGQPARRIDLMYRISRDDMQACDRALTGIEGEGAVAAARYREVIAALLPPVLVLRDYHNESDFVEDNFARAREQHPAVVAGLALLEEASTALRARATAVRSAIAAARPPEPRDLAAELYFGLLALDDLLAAGAPAADIDAAIAALEAARDEARAAVADLAGSTTADQLDDVLEGVSAVMSAIKGKRRRLAREPGLRLGPNALHALEYDVFRNR